MKLIDADALIQALSKRAEQNKHIPLVEHDFRELIHEADEFKAIALDTVYSLTSYDVEITGGGAFGPKFWITKR